MHTSSIRNIGVDLDGVLYDFGAALRNYLIEHEDFDEALLTYPKVWNFFLEWGLTLDDYLHYYAKGVDAGYVLLEGRSDPMALTCLSLMRDAGHQIHIVTYRTVGARAVQNTMEWLQRERVPYDTLTFAKDKTIIKTDYFIEDNMENFTALREAGTEAFLLDRPWNSELDTPYRISDWVEFYRVIERWDNRWIL